MERAIKSYDPDLPEDPITKTFDAIQNQVHTVDHHSLEYGPSNKNLFQTMGVFHTMGGPKKIIFFQFLKYLSKVDFLIWLNIGTRYA